MVSKSKKSQTLDDLILETVKSCISSYVNSLTECELKKLVSPIIEYHVKKEFHDKIVPAISKNINMSIDSKINKILKEEFKKLKFTVSE